jgi:two-component system, OmpR family, sensor histidine kinase SenX3
MGRFGGSHSLLALCGPLLVLLAALAVVQYRWSTRVASAAAQREKEHLDSAASLFANEFNGIVEQASAFVQNDARVALDSGQRLVPVPRVIGELDYIEFPAQGGPQARRLSADGLFAPSPMPEWIAVPRCAPLAISQPPALVVPVYDVATEDGHGAAGTRIRKGFMRQEDRCFVARIDQCYLHDTLFPRLIRQTFGPTATQEYDFAVVPLGRPTEALYGAPLLRDDLEKPFFSLAALLAIAKHSALADAPQAVFIQRVETGITDDQMRIADPFGRGIWELKVAHKGLPLPAAFERTRRLDLLLSWGVELLLGAAIVLLVIGTRRIELLAEQKMRFVAGVSHELRTPVSAISMLSRNQADGLVADPEKVKQYGELIHQRSRRLNEMVEQTLQYAGIQSVLHRPKRDEVKLTRLIQEAVDARRDELVRAGFEIQIALPPDLPPVWGDAPLLRIALDNLLSNAHKHASAGHWIRVSASVSSPEREVRISVEDHGDGIDPTEQAEIFEPFSRGRAAVEAQIPGSGLGLSLVRSAAEAHRGRVTLVSEPGRGSAFTMHLPL